MLLRSAAVAACSSPCATAASPAATSLSRPGKSKSGAGTGTAFMRAFYRGGRRPVGRLPARGRAPGAACGGSGPARQGVEEAGNGRAEAVEVDQEGIVPLRRFQRQEMR